MVGLNGSLFVLGFILVAITIPVIVAFLAGITRLARHHVTSHHVIRIGVDALRYVLMFFQFMLVVAGTGLVLISMNKASLVESRFDFPFLLSLARSIIIISLIAGSLSLLARYYVTKIGIGALRYVFRLSVVVFGLGLILVGYSLVEARIDFLGGFLLVIGIQTFCWMIGIRLEILGNVTEDIFDRQGEAPRASSAVQQ